MRIFLIVSILFFFGAQTAKAESVWLVLLLFASSKPSAAAAAFEKIEMEDMKQCEEQGSIYVSSKRIINSKTWNKPTYKGFECLKGK